MNGIRIGRALMGALFALVATSLASAQSPRAATNPCDRACLTRAVDAYIAGLIANDPARVPFAPNAKLTLNDDVVAARGLFWEQAASVQARIDIANPRWGDTGTQAVINNADGSQYIYAFRLKVKDSRIIEAEAILVRNVGEGGLWDVKSLQKPNANFNMKIRIAEQDSYYDLVAAAEGYWRAFNTNGTPEYHPAEFWPNVQRLENGYRTTDVAFQNNTATSAAEQFDTGLHAGRNIWDLRYPVVDEEYGVVMSFARFGLKTGFTPNRPAQAATRLVAEFFAVRKGQIWDIQAVMVNRDEKLPSAWAPDYGPTRGGWAPITCDRACLTRHIDAYYAALLARDANALPQAAKAKITLNGDVVPLARSFPPRAQKVRWRFDIVNERLGDTGTQVVITNADGSETMEIVRLKVVSGAITEMEIVRCNKGEAGDQWWGPEQLDKEPSAFLKLPIPPAERNSYYELVSVADGYFRAFQTNGTPDYHRTDILPDTTRFENGVHFTGTVRNGVYATVADGFDRGRFIGRNLWDRRHAVVDEERGIVLMILRFGKIDGVQNAASVTQFDRIVGEFFSVKSGKIQEVQAVLVNRQDSQPTGWDTKWYGPGQGGWSKLPTGQGPSLPTPVGASAAPVPSVSGSTYSLAVGETKLTADGPSGRVTGLSFRGTNLLIGSEVNNVTYGSSFWTSPQTWSWPPAIDASTFLHRIDATANRIVFVSGDVVVSDHPLSIEKRFWADASRNAIVAEYTVTNKGSDVLRFAPWQITRVASEGFVFYPRGAADPAGQTRRGAPQPIRNVTVSDGIVWYDFTGNDPQTKSVGDGAEGWLAYVANGVLLLQSFVDIPAGAQAEGEGEVEVYTAPNNRLIELEPQGAAVDLAPGATSQPWRAYWYVRAVPPGMNVGVGSKALVDWVRTILP